MWRICLVGLAILTNGPAGEGKSIWMWEFICVKKLPNDGYLAISLSSTCPSYPWQINLPGRPPAR